MPKQKLKMKILKKISSRDKVKGSSFQIEQNGGIGIKFFWLKNKYFKYVIFLSLAAGVAVGGFFLNKKEEIYSPLVPQISIEEKYPRLANLFFKWDITDEEARELAKWDVVVIDMEAQVATPENLRKLKQYNPQIKILAYITSQEFTTHFSHLKASSLRRKLYQGLSTDKWWLKSKNGGRLMWWPGTWLINVTDDAPLSSGKRWNDYLPEFVANEILSSGLWDGVFFDNLWQSISWLPSGDEIDLNGDGVAESQEVVDEKWREGMNKILKRTKDLAPGKIIVGNGVGGWNIKPYYKNINGVAIEHFHKANWQEAMANYFFILEKSQRPPVTILNSNTENTGRRDDYKKMRFGLTSALLGDGYFSFDYGDQAHSQLWWYDEYSSFLGKPLGQAYNIKDKSTEPKEGVWRRDFKNGIVLVNATLESQTIKLKEAFEKISGQQDTVHNDGSVVQSVTLDARDGIILFRRVEESVLPAFTNGSFVRLFNGKGKSIRPGFFTCKDRFLDGENIVMNDLEGDGSIETIIAGASQILVLNEQGKKITSFYPYGENYNKGINIAVGDLNNDGKKEIVTGTDQGGGPHVRIFNYQGRLIHPGFFAYNKNFRGGVNVALGDLDGNGWLEIITGAGFGGGPHVRIWSGGGKLLHPGFFAYDPNFRGGIYVAAGDTDGDGKAEIITGAGSGGGPRVKVFDGQKFTLKSDFFAFDAQSRSGAEVVAVDLDNDGKVEIAVSTFDISAASE